MQMRHLNISAMTLSCHQIMVMGGDMFTFDMLLNLIYLEMEKIGEGGGDGSLILMLELCWRSPVP